MIRLIVYSIMLSCSFFPSRSSALDMNIAVNTAEKLVYVNLWGEIKEGDDAKFRALVLPWVRSGHLIFQVNIFSVGGSVPAAIGIGKQIRTLQARTAAPWRAGQIVNGQKVDLGYASCSFSKAVGGIVSFEAITGYNWCTCASACFLIWASGSTREGGIMGIHRPSFRGPEYGNLPPEEAKKKYEMAESMFRSYTSELKIPSSILDRLFATDSQSIYYLTWPEMQLLQSTPYLEEMVLSRCGPDQSEHMSAANNWTATQDINHVNCLRGILKELMSTGAQAYLTASAVEPEGSFPPERNSTSSQITSTHWLHNGSSFDLVATANRKRLIFASVRPGLQEVGVRPGAALLDGVQDGQSIQGTAYVFSKRCGAISYAVAGSFDEQRIVVTGWAPYVDASCSIRSRYEATMVFERAN